MGPESSAFDLSGNTLRIKGELCYEAEHAFEASLGALLASGDKCIVLDLSAVSYMSSCMIRHIATAFVEASEEGRTLTVRAGPRIYGMLLMTGVDELGRVDLIE